MGWGEKHGVGYRARWFDDDGEQQSKSGFATKKAAERYANDREADVRAGRYVDPRAGQITLTEWVNEWYPTLDLEWSTMANYRIHLEVHALVKFGDRAIASITPEEVNAWERDLARSGACSQRTARDIRSTLSTCLGDAVPGRIPRNPAERRRARGKKATRRIEKTLAGRRAWATPLEVLLIAERAAALSGHDSDFVMLISIAYTGMRWSEAVGLAPDCVNGDTWNVDWKLYELNGHLYRGRPKDGSIRTVDIPPFLSQLMSLHLGRQTITKCVHDPGEEPYCPSGQPYVFLGPKGGHARRSDFARRFFIPAAAGSQPAQGGKGGAKQRPRIPVFADVSDCWPGVPLVASAPRPGEPFDVSAGMRRRPVSLPVNSRSTRNQLADYAIMQGVPYDQVQELTREQLLDLYVRPAPPGAVAAWLPIVADLTRHGLRHAQETWMAEDRVADVFRDERMGHIGEHESRGRMRDNYTHSTDRMRAELMDAQQQRWTQSLTDRLALERHSGLSRSPVPIVDELLAPFREKAVPVVAEPRKDRPLQLLRPRQRAARVTA
jgi:integrase